MSAALYPVHVHANIIGVSCVSSHTDELDHNIASNSCLAKKPIEIYQTRCNGDTYAGS